MRGLILVVLLATLTGGVARAAIYKWVDENGSMHFSDKPPQTKPAEVYTPGPVNTYKDETTPGRSSTNTQVRNYLANEQARQDFGKKLREQEAKSKANMERFSTQSPYSSYQERVKDLHRRRWQRQQLDRRAGIN